MKALIFDGKHLTLQAVPKPEPEIGEALVQVIYSGICNTDIEIVKGYMNFTGTLGHEFAGIVRKCGQREWVGKRVVGEINCGCGQCDYCRKGMQRHCPQRKVLGILEKNGAHAEFLTLPIENLHVLPGEVKTEQAVLVEPLAAALEIVEQIHILPGEKVAVIGDGKLGQLVARVLRLYSPDLTVIEKNENKLSLLQEKGIETRLFHQVNLPRQDIVVECSGVAQGLELANKLIRPRGKLVLKSTYHGDIPFNPAIWVIDEITLIGSRCGPFDPAIDLLQNGLIETDDLISAVFTGKKCEEAFAFAQQKNVLKVLIQWGES